ncbi:MAG: hypothetical protein A3G35_10960 [candidate division NC10 bacterium RIFCSPLOWO2_12_FULL_66_18]|nr:MAG: hypothetical protein A3G35_10960 [candidate division NC10 bacterium RIFCSPLOWO2_12_FULL_66_18]
MRIIEAVTIQWDPDLYLDLRALTRYLSLSRRTLQDLVNDPADPLPTFRIGVKLVARRGEVDAWMSRRRNHKPLEAARLAAADARALLHARPRKQRLTSSRYRAKLLTMRKRPTTQGKEVRIVRLSVYLSEDLHRAIMHRCVDENISFTKLAERLLQDYLKTALKKKGGR